MSALLQSQALNITVSLYQPEYCVLLYTGSNNVLSGIVVQIVSKRSQASSAVHQQMAAYPEVAYTVRESSNLNEVVCQVTSLRLLHKLKFEFCDHVSAVDCLFCHGHKTREVCYRDIENALTSL